MDGGIHELGELVRWPTRGAGAGEGGQGGQGLDIILIVSKVNTADETENRLGKLDADFN